MPGTAVTITRFAREVISLGPLKLPILKPIETIVENIEGDILEILARVSEREIAREDVAYVVAEIKGGGSRLVYGDTRLKSKDKLALPKPSRLIRVGVVRTSSLKYNTKLGGLVFKEDNIEWYPVSGDLYVLEYPVEAESDVAFVILETDLGTTILRIADLSRSELISQLQDRQAEESPLGESGSGEENIPS